MSEFTDILESEIPKLRRSARALTRDPVRADDLVQSALVRAITRQHLWQPGTNLRAWLFTILHHQNINDVRRSLREGDGIPVDHVALVDVCNPTAALQIRDLDRAIAALPSGQRQVILLIGLDGMRYEDVGRILKVPVGTGRSRLSRGRETLRRLIDVGEQADVNPGSPSCKVALSKYRRALVSGDRVPRSRRRTARRRLSR